MVACVGVVLLIFFGIAFACNVTALFAADYTASSLEANIDDIEDLRGKKVCTVEDTVTMDYLKEWGAIAVPYKSFEEAVDGMLRGEGDAAVFDTPVVRYYTKNEGASKVFLVPGIFHPEYYGFAFPEGSPLREKVNQALLDIREREAQSYAEIYKKWF
jgi:polar amino acid transport system substrate-binding protein